MCIRDRLPIILKGKSDSSSMDMTVELLLSTGRSLPEVMMMLVPEAWEKHKTMDTQKKAFYKYNSCIMEPWDGPASIVFSDGKYIGAVLDRNGLRPSRYYITHDDKCIMASEVGVLEVDPSNVKTKGRLQPGKIFLLDFDQGRLVSDEEVKKKLIALRGVGPWTAEMILMFSLLRPDIFPVDDIGAIRAMEKLYNNGKQMNKKELMKKAEDGWMVNHFVSGAKMAYEEILMAFEKGDLFTIEKMTSKEVCESFKSVIFVPKLLLTTICFLAIILFSRSSINKRY